MPWNFGYNNPDNPNYFEQPGDMVPAVEPPMGGSGPFPWDENIRQGSGVEYGGETMPYPVPPGEDPLTGAQEGLGGFDLGKFLQGLPKGILDMMPGSDGKSIAAGLMIPSWLSALKQWQDSGKYADTAKEAAKYGDPFGQANREYYQGQLKNSYEHPEMFLNDPGHQAKLKSGLDQVSRQDAMKGYLGSGNMAADLSAYTTNLNNQFLDQERARLMGLTGAQFNPAAAGEFLMKGNEQEIASQNAALQALMMPFAMNMGENHINNNNAGGGTPGGNGGAGGGGTKYETLNPDGSPKPIDWSKYHTTPQQVASEILKASGGMGGSAYDLIKAVLSNPFANVSESTKNLINDMWDNPNSMKELESLFPETGAGPRTDFLGNPIEEPIDYTGAGGSSIWGPSVNDTDYGPVGGIGSVDYGPGLDFGIDDTPIPEMEIPTWELNTPEPWDFTGFD